ncbi:MAG: hypothetical protein ABIN91_17210 [Mucilaginibacter sp.]|uniref:hypothetical protein n=1 Tax=Mucilaginibacter sp. TaxID=1882438 RepID=UPI003265484E
MIAQDEFLRKTFKLKEAIKNSSDIKKEIKDLLDKVTIDFGPRISPIIDRNHIYKIYQGRLHLLESRGKWNESFAILFEKT